MTRFPYVPDAFDSFETAKTRALAHAAELGDRFRFIKHEATAVVVYFREAPHD